MPYRMQVLVYRPEMATKEFKIGSKVDNFYNIQVNSGRE